MIDQKFRAEHERRHLVLEQGCAGHHLAQAEGLDVADQHGADIVEGIDRERAVSGPVPDENSFDVSSLDGNVRIR